MKAMSLNIKNEEYVKYARLMGIKEYIVMFKYVLPNSLLPQITVLALQFGTMFSGAFLTERKKRGFSSFLFKGVDFAPIALPEIHEFCSWQEVQCLGPI